MWVVFRKELRRSISEKMSGVESDAIDIPKLPLPSNSFFVSTATSKGSSRRSPCHRRHVFTKVDALRALERERLAQQRLRTERQARRKEAEEAIRLRRQAVEEANRFNKFCYELLASLLLLVCYGFFIGGRVADFSPMHPLNEMLR
ncbi:unnamed protein product [Angiostrongylus costaricensis]|uniref:Uncharacterized protein n=1 Tax=Angiostrongylus costaricensis TaxID=334426 RepID=A0A0R3PAH6_ANGCS|nr:unnamed protein product [Angiostrongylus costaricensis]